MFFVLFSKLGSIENRFYYFGLNTLNGRLFGDEFYLCFAARNENKTGIFSNPYLEVGSHMFYNERTPNFLQPPAKVASVTGGAVRNKRRRLEVLDPTEEPDVQLANSVECRRLLAVCRCELPGEKLSDIDSRDMTREQLDNRCQARSRNREDRLERCTSIVSKEHDINLHYYPQTAQLAIFCNTHQEHLRSHKICPLCNEFYSFAAVS